MAKKASKKPKQIQEILNVLFKKKNIMSKRIKPLRYISLFPWSNLICHGPVFFIFLQDICSSVI
jgi:hypothetical protein